MDNEKDCNYLKKYIDTHSIVDDITKEKVFAFDDEPIFDYMFQHGIEEFCYDILKFTSEYLAGGMFNGVTFIDYQSNPTLIYRDEVIKSDDEKDETKEEQIIKKDDKEITITSWNNYLKNDDEKIITSGEDLDHLKKLVEWGLRPGKLNALGEKTEDDYNVAIIDPILNYMKDKDIRKFRYLCFNFEILGIKGDKFQSSGFEDDFFPQEIPTLIYGIHVLNSK